MENFPFFNSLTLGQLVILAQENDLEINPDVDSLEALQMDIIYSFDELPAYYETSEDLYQYLSHLSLDMLRIIAELYGIPDTSHSLRTTITRSITEKIFA